MKNRKVTCGEREVVHLTDIYRKLVLLVLKGAESLHAKDYAIKLIEEMEC